MARIIINDQSSARGFDCALELTRYGHRIVTTNDPALLTEIVQKVEVDLVVVCIDGCQNGGLVQKLKSLAPDTPILIYPKHHVESNNAAENAVCEEAGGEASIERAAGVG